MKNICFLVRTIFILTIFTLLIGCFKSTEKLINNDYNFYPYKVDDLWGYYDKEKDKHILPKFESADFFQNDYAIIKLDGKYGFLNKSGEIQIKNKFDEASNFNRLNVAKVKKNDKEYWINRKGKKVKYERKNSSNCGTHYRPLKIPILEDYVLENKDGKKAIYFPKYDTSTDFEFDSIISCSYDISIVSKDSKYGFHRIDMPNTYKGKLLCGYKTRYIYDEIKLESIEYDKVKRPYQFARTRQGDKWGIISIVTLREVFLPRYSDIDLSMSKYIHPTLFLVEFKKNNFGYVNFKGEELFPN